MPYQAPPRRASANRAVPSHALLFILNNLLVLRMHDLNLTFAYGVVYESRANKALLPLAFFLHRQQLMVDVRQ